ncbi:PrgI family protein [Candidatus Woesearchaeota archaeon]|nr:PrgI family protein [Candidatus Woesearchaeota archaeon]
MSYEIPQQLQYEEKIIFGLTFKQLIYACIFGIPCLLIFFKSKIDIYIRAVIAMVLLGVASLFMFFNFSTYLKNILNWFKFREIRHLDLKMVQFIGIEKIQNGVVYVCKDKKYPKKKK